MTDSIDGDLEVDDSDQLCGLIEYRHIRRANLLALKVKYLVTRRQHVGNFRGTHDDLGKGFLDRKGAGFVHCHDDAPEPVC